MMLLSARMPAHKLSHLMVLSSILRVSILTPSVANDNERPKLPVTNEPRRSQRETFVLRVIRVFALLANV